MSDAKKMKIAGLIHDIGKIGVDERILNKLAVLPPRKEATLKGIPRSAGGCWVQQMNFLSWQNMFSAIMKIDASTDT